MFGLFFGPLEFEGDYHGRITVGGLGGTLQLSAILVGITGRPELGFSSFSYARHTGENKSENKKFNNKLFQSRTKLQSNALEKVNGDEGSILTRGVNV